MRKPLIAANWKMNEPPKGFNAADSVYRTREDVDVIVFATFLSLADCLAAGLHVGAQYGRAEQSGAFTGDISMQMVKNAGVEAVLCGHSERRKYHGETDTDVAAQASMALKLGLHPIVCVGETLEERQKGKAKDVVRQQMRGLPSGLTIAYEPVWAINKGQAATPKDVQEMHSFIRIALRETDRAATRILYGGSMNAANAEAILRQPDIDGGLIGGASLVPEDFGDIVHIARRVSAEKKA